MRCVFCNQFIKTKKIWIGHIRECISTVIFPLNANNLRVYDCPNCKCFRTSRASLRVHLLARSCFDADDHEFQCHRCDSCFTTAYALKLHIERLVCGSIDGPNSRKYRCKVCSSAFANAQELKSHQRGDNHCNRVLSDKRTICTWCHTRFASRKNMKAHIKYSCAMVPRKVHCTKCNIQCTSFFDLKIHADNAHVEQEDTYASHVEQEDTYASDILDTIINADSDIEAQEDTYASDILDTIINADGDIEAQEDTYASDILDIIINADKNIEAQEDAYVRDILDTIIIAKADSLDLDIVDIVMI